MLRYLAGAAAMASLFACGGSKSDDLFTGRPQQTTSSTEDGESSSSSPALGAIDAGAGGAARDAAAEGPPNADGGNAHDAGATSSCMKLKAEVDKLRPEAMACSLTAVQLQCSQTVDDICCKLWVTSKDTQAVKSFTAAVHAYKQAGCTAYCGNTECQDEPTTCMAMSGTRGACKQ